MTRSWGCGENLFSNYWISGNLDDLESWQGVATVTSMDTNLLAPGRSPFLPRLSLCICTRSSNSTKLDDGLLGSKQERMSDTGGGHGPGRGSVIPVPSPWMACSEGQAGSPSWWHLRRMNDSASPTTTDGYSTTGIIILLKMPTRCKSLCSPGWWTPFCFVSWPWSLRISLWNSIDRPWCWDRLRAGGEEGNREWDGWMASPTQWTWFEQVRGLLWH